MILAKHKDKNRVIRFIPQVATAANTPSDSVSTLIRKATPYLFPDNGNIDVSIEELSKMMNVPPEFIDTEEDSLKLLQAEYKKKDSKILSNDAYEAYFTLLKMLELYKLTNNSNLPVNVNETKTLLENIDSSLESGKLNWQFKRDWDSKFASLTKKITKVVNKNASRKESQKIIEYETVELQKFFALVQIAFADEQKSHGRTSPKAEYLARLHEIVQNIMIRYKIELIPKQIVDAAQEAIERYQEGHRSGAYCLSSDEHLLVLLEPFKTVNALVQTIYNQLKALLDQNRGWFYSCNTGNYAKTDIDPKLYVEVKTILQNGKCETTEANIKKLLKEMEPYRAWYFYDRLYTELQTTCERKSGGGQIKVYPHGIINKELGTIANEFTHPEWRPLSQTFFAFQFPFSYE